jgi:hypothetical protein
VSGKRHKKSRRKIAKLERLEKRDGERKRQRDTEALHNRIMQALTEEGVTDRVIKVHGALSTMEIFMPAREKFRGADLSKPAVLAELVAFEKRLLASNGYDLTDVRLEATPGVMVGNVSWRCVPSAEAVLRACRRIGVEPPEDLLATVEAQQSGARPGSSDTMKGEGPDHAIPQPAPGEGSGAAEGGAGGVPPG